MEIVVEKTVDAMRPEFSGNDGVNGIIADMPVVGIETVGKEQFTVIDNPKRFNFIKRGKIFIAKKIRLLMEYMNPKLEDSYTSDRIEHLKPCEGKVIAAGNMKYGIYRDENKFLHAVCAECVKEQCIIKWNAGKKSWDCASCRSRFSYKGKKIKGASTMHLHYYKMNASDIFRA